MVVKTHVNNTLEQQKIFMLDLATTHFEECNYQRKSDWEAKLIDQT